MLAWDREEPGRFRFAALQSDAGRALLRRSGRSPDDISSIVLVERHASHTKSAAVLRIAAGLQAPLPLVSAALDFTFPQFFKDAVYDQIADNRYSLFGRTSACRLSDPRFEERFVS
ncbi:DCC family chloroplastic [Micractinium conductrix]|uniref:DCC family chloroplastic n=1 Tax=Micractinium conductrix TaxID=554055 RepID=A0A2P6VQY8_9CHLO|nr:DCC family chloroplastic [Micractinium conductrix]|eukprot:PSC76509.1 DCC family chloroplastic [Micractinium conductrix]